MLTEPQPCGRGQNILFGPSALVKLYMESGVYFFKGQPFVSPYEGRYHSSPRAYVGDISSQQNCMYKDLYICGSMVYAKLNKLIVLITLAPDNDAASAL